MDYITTRIGRLPGKIEEIALNGGRSVADALAASELDSEGYEIRVNGSPADFETELDNGDTVLLVKKIKGNQEFVRIGRLPGKIEEYAFEDGSTVEDALETAGLDSEGYEVRLNGSPADMDDSVSDGDTVLLVKKIKGN